MPKEMASVQSSNELFVHNAVRACFAQLRRVIPAVPHRHEDLRIERAPFLLPSRFSRAVQIEIDE